MLCLCWTRALRTHMAIRSLGAEGAYLPFTVTIQQLFATVLTPIVLFFTRGLWSPLLPDGSTLMGIVGGTFAAFMITRDRQIEGRSLPRYAKSLIVYTATSTADRVRRVKPAGKTRGFRTSEWA